MSENDIKAEDSMTPPESEVEVVEVVHEMQEVSGGMSNTNAIDKAIAQLIDINESNIVHEPTCFICSSPHRTVIEDKYVENKDMADWVIFPGKIAENGYTPDDDLFALIRNAHLYVCPSKQEGFGITFLEAMGLGVPTILSNASCIPEVAGDAGHKTMSSSPAQCLLRVADPTP